jgi:hypothetical protein
MNAGLALGDWIATRCVGTGTELHASAIKGRSLNAVLSRTLPSLTRADFIIVRAVEVTPSHLRLAEEALSAAHSRVRLCLAATRATLQHLMDHRIGRVGFMLDDVDIQTPCSEFVWEGFEAVRFSDGFLAQAKLDLRAHCALASMLSLSRELGLTTFGPLSNHPGVPPLDFDYVPVTMSKQQRLASRSERRVRSMGRASSIGR